MDEYEEQQDNVAQQIEAICKNRSESHCSYGGCHKLDVYDWLAGTPQSTHHPDVVEVRFKNTRKEFFRNVNHLALQAGDVVAVEASPGHDIGRVSLTGELVLRKLHRYGIDARQTEFKKVYRKAKPADIEKWRRATDREYETMIRSRQIASELRLDMKIGDVEYQGDSTKAIFYYIADERVDFRELIKVLAEQFRIRVEMKQIGARQEAGRIGGIGSCGRELCCATWITNFVSVTTNAARVQELSLNPQKLAGQCGKLKCCLNYELEVYKDAKKDYPSPDINLKTKEGEARHVKTDIFKEIMYYATDPENALNMVALPVDSVKKILALNRKGVVVDNLLHFREVQEDKNVDYENVAGQEDVTRFDKKKKRPPKKHKYKPRKNPKGNRRKNS